MNTLIMHYRWIRLGLGNLFLNFSILDDFIKVKKNEKDSAGSLTCPAAG